MAEAANGPGLWHVGGLGFVLVHTWWVVLVAEIAMAAAGLVYKLT